VASFELVETKWLFLNGDLASRILVVPAEEQYQCTL